MFPPHLKTLTRPAAPNPFDKLTQPELDLLCAVANRAANILKSHSKLAKDPNVEMHPQLLAMDFALAHIANPIRLRALLEAPEIDFISDWALVTINIDRTLAFFPRHVKLRFAASGGVYIPGT